MLGRIFDFDAQAFDLNHYQALPDDWYIAIADVVSSTQLARLGRDKDVNFVAAACVAVLQQLLEAEGEPAAVQFGGDGVIAAIPADRHELARTRLAALAHWSGTQFQIPLRIGMVPVSALHQSGLPCYASLQILDNLNAFGVFLGDGIQAADDWVKQQSIWQIEPFEGELPGLEDLSCRWQPVKSHRGLVLSLIIDPVESGNPGIEALEQTVRILLSLIADSKASPLSNLNSLRPPAIPSWTAVRRELKTPASTPSLTRVFKAYMESFILWLAWRMGGKLGKIDAHRYLNSLSRKSDYRKQAGGARMVLDLTAAEATAVEQALEAAELRGDILYGVARSDAATLTCLVGDFQADDHVHFIDGEGLGFWRASVMLKDKRISRAQKF